ncbi:MULTISPECIES: hypothetical protein [unclassified Shinella]|uniref:hypothetical protein n=1 Tax=unclassified Shinella TaxID=2643062 RepID=UPI00225C5600|nr:hypothetical protein [Shinella sp. YE25]MDC7259455.1 hypothetical protein [Shinella sp. YE25]CAI0341209.1 conserved hypothetical protein [Rhizobiaceae bacterium]CAK7260850.1 conserved protein of unknown function [Shinella sp. WSC3-e]
MRDGSQSNPLSTERRSRRRALIALPFMLPLAAVAVGYERLYWAWWGNHLIERNVESGRAEPYGGSDWMLVRVARHEQPRSTSIPRGSVLLIVDLKVRVGSAKSVTRIANMTREEYWGACKVGLVDSSGRTWAASTTGHAPDIYPPSQANIATCGSHSQGNWRPEDSIIVRETFTIPADVAGSVRPTLMVDGEQPYYLSFTREKR